MSGPVRRRRVEARPADSWALAVARARETFDGLTGGPTRCLNCGGRRVPPGLVCGQCGGEGPWVYCGAAGAAIMSTALGLWADSARQLEDGA